MSDLNNTTETRIEAIEQNILDAQTAAANAATAADSATTAANNAATAAAAAAIPMQPAAPDFPLTGALWIDTSSAPLLKMWNGAAWLTGSFA